LTTNELNYKLLPLYEKRGAMAITSIQTYPETLACTYCSKQHSEHFRGEINEDHLKNIKKIVLRIDSVEIHFKCDHVFRTACLDVSLTKKENFSCPKCISSLSTALESSPQNEKLSENGVTTPQTTENSTSAEHRDDNEIHAYHDRLMTIYKSNGWKGPIFDAADY
jgi:hypothetical protein